MINPAEAPALELRPRLTAVVTFPCEPAMRTAIHMTARSLDRSASSYIRRLVQADLDRRARA